MKTKQVKIRLPYDATTRVTKQFAKKSRAKQSFKDECNINTIMLKYEKTGILEYVRQNQGSYADFSNVTDYQTALNTIMEAEASFSSLPAKVRAGFGNDPGAFLAWMEDPANKDQAIELGLMPMPETPPSPEPKAAPPRPEEPAQGGSDKKNPPASPEGMSSAERRP